MELLLGLDKVKKRHKGGILALGTFDGVHLGHQKVIKSLKRRAGDLRKKSIVLTFDIHPLKTIDPAKSPPLLTPREEKINLIQNLGVDILVLANFDRRFASLSPERFIKDILIDRLGVEEVFVGKDFTFGRGATGDIAFLKKKSKECGFRVNVIPPVKMGKTAISSTAIRELIRRGEVRKAARLLGRSYVLYGRVVRGEARGKELGYPTANIRPRYEVVPSDGVYVGRVRVPASPARFDREARQAGRKGKDWDGLLNIGTQPTFHKRGTRIIEAHIFDFEGRVYGQDIKVSFLEKIREEMAFKSPEALKAQIKKDVTKARKYLSRWR